MEAREEIRACEEKGEKKGMDRMRNPTKVTNDVSVLGESSGRSLGHKGWIRLLAIRSVDRGARAKERTFLLLARSAVTSLCLRFLSVIRLLLCRSCSLTGSWIYSQQRASLVTDVIFPSFLLFPPPFDSLCHSTKSLKTKPTHPSTLDLLFITSHHITHTRLLLGIRHRLIIASHSYLIYNSHLCLCLVPGFFGPRLPRSFSRRNFICLRLPVCATHICFSRDLPRGRHQLPI